MKTEDRRQKTEAGRQKTKGERQKRKAQGTEQSAQSKKRYKTKVKRQNEMVELLSDNKKMLLRETLFWDINPAGLNSHTSRSLIIERVLTRGNIDEFKQLIRFYSIQDLTQTVLKIGYMDGRTLNFIAEYLNLSKSDFLCYRKKLSNPEHCNF